VLSRELKRELKKGRRWEKALISLHSDELEKKGGFVVRRGWWRKKNKVRWRRLKKGGERRKGPIHNLALHDRFYDNNSHPVCKGKEAQGAGRGNFRPLPAVGFRKKNVTTAGETVQLRKGENYINVVRSGPHVC